MSHSIYFGNFVPKLKIDELFRPITRIFLFYDKYYLFFGSSNAGIYLSLGIGIIIEQEKGVEKGWFPENPKRK